MSFSKGSRKEFYRNNTHHILEKGDWFAVEGVGGYDVGQVSLTGELVARACQSLPAGAVLLSSFSVAALRAAQSAAPAVPPAPPRYISKPVTPAATPGTPSKSALTGGLYVVGAGDTLSAISRRSGVSVAELARINGIADPNKIQAGQKIRLSASNNGIPVAAPAPASTKAAAKAGADQPSSTANSGTTFTGSSTGRTYVVGQVYVNSQGVQKMAMADGTFKAI